MTTSWKDRAWALILERTEVRQAPLEQALSGLRTTVPQVEVIDEGTPGATLQWSWQPVHASEPLAGAFWDFLELVDASDETIVAFARDFGPLLWTEASELDPSSLAPTDAARVSSADAVLARPCAESVRTWRMAARGLRALYDLIDPALPRDKIRSEILTWSAAPTALSLWLADPDPAAEPLEEGWLVALVMAEYGLGTDPGIADIPWADRLLIAALAAAEVGPAFPSDPSAGLVYTLPATPIAAPDGDGEVEWQVKGLLPILTVCAAIAARTQERPRCTRCGRPAVVVTRGPQAGRQWYGDHAVCRALSRAETIMKAEQKRGGGRTRPADKNGA